jgi:hypothetical protein
MPRGSPGGRAPRRTARSEPTNARTPPETRNHDNAVQARRCSAARHVSDPAIDAALDAIVDAAPPCRTRRGCAWPCCFAPIVGRVPMAIGHDRTISGSRCSALLAEGSVVA